MCYRTFDSGTGEYVREAVCGSALRAYPAALVHDKILHDIDLTAANYDLRHWLS